jgi:peptidoglycan/LPS O-acetylase OafA/YrhL
MFDQQQVTLKTLFGFWTRRWFRTLPNYFLILIILISLGFHYQTLTATSHFNSYFFFLANFKDAMPDFLFPEAWSLSIEEWFYLLIPVFIFILVAAYHYKPKTAVLTVAVSVIVFSTAFRYYRLLHWPHITGEQIDSSFRKQVITRLDSLMFGVIGAFILYYYPLIWKRYAKQLFFIGILLLYAGFLQYLFGYFGLTYTCVFSYSLESIGFLCLFPCVSQLITGKGWIYHIITYISVVSYSIYLINYSIVKYYIIGYFDRHLFKNISGSYLPFVQYFVFWVITIFASILLYKYFEKPMTDLRERAS